jgi:hypothetical protein
MNRMPEFLKATLSHLAACGKATRAAFQTPAEDDLLSRVLS